jgi:hypothetical protein
VLTPCSRSMIAVQSPWSLYKRQQIFSPIKTWRFGRRSRSVLKKTWGRYIYIYM